MNLRCTTWASRAFFEIRSRLFYNTKKKQIPLGPDRLLFRLHLWGYLQRRKHMMCWHEILELYSSKSTLKHTYILWGCWGCTLVYSFPLPILILIFIPSPSPSPSSFKLCICLLISLHFHASLIFAFLLFYHPTHQVTTTAKRCLAQTWISHLTRSILTGCSSQKIPNLIFSRNQKGHPSSV